MQKELHEAFRFELLTLLVAPGILACLAYGAWLANFGGLSLLEQFGLCIGVGVITGVVGIVAGHELCHRASWYERFLGRLLLCCATYGHCCDGQMLRNGGMGQLRGSAIEGRSEGRTNRPEV